MRAKKLSSVLLAFLLVLPVMVAPQAVRADFSTGDGTYSWQNPRPQGVNSFNGVSCPSSTDCVAAGDGGNITGSFDGARWSERISGTAVQMKAVSCPDTSHCFAVGAGGAIRVSSDGGVSWSAQTSNTASALNGVSCPTSAICFAAGAAGAMVSTSNGGSTWTANTVTTAALNGISCPSATTCWTVGALSGSNPVIRFTNNSGSTWATQTNATTVALNAVSCPSTTSCVAVGALKGSTSVILTTTNTGGTWTAQANTATQALNGVSCVSATTACVTVGNAGVVLNNSTGFSSFTVRASGLTQNLVGISCSAVTTCFAAGAVGTLAQSTNANSTASFTNQSAVTISALNGASCPSTAVCEVVGASGTILRTTNGGNAWVVQTSGTATTLNAISCPTVSICYAVGASGLIRQSANGGSTWATQGAGVTANALLSVSCASATQCAIGGASGTILYTGNSGATWTKTTMFSATPSVSGMTCVVATTTCFGTAGTSLGYNLTAFTTNTWTQQSHTGTTNTLNSVSCPTTTFCAAAGNAGTVRTSTTPTSTTTWTTPTATGTAATLNSISCPAPTACYAVGAGGVAIDQQSNPNGTWTARSAGTANNLLGIACATGCSAVGAAGTVLSNSRPSAPSTMAASPTSLRVSSGSSLVTVTVLDLASNPLFGDTVSLASSRGATDTVAPAALGSSVTNGSGVATFSVSSSTVGNPVFTATDLTANPTFVLPATVQVAFTDLPGAPMIGSATRADQSANVTWTAPVSNGNSPITRYTLTSSPATNSQMTPNGTTLSLTFTGLTNGTSYTFSVTATNAIGTGPASAPSNAVVPAGLPTAPTAVIATTGVNQASVSWAASGSNGSALIRYTVSSNPATTAQSTPDGATLSLTFTGLAAASSYTFTVTATNAVGTGPASSSSGQITTPGLPGAPTIGTASRGDQSATVNWTAPSSNGGNAISAYRVTPSSGTAQSASGSSTSLLFTGLTNGSSYTFTVAAQNGVGYGPESAASNAVVPAGLPFAPTAANATTGPDQATVNWTAPGANGSAITKYTVTSTPATSAQSTADGSTVNLVFTGLFPATNYTFKVTATNAVGAGAASGASNSILTPDHPGIPTIGTAVGGDQSATVNWTAPSSDGGNAITGYVVTASSGANQAAGASATSLVFTGLANGMPYTFTVAANNAVGTGAASASSNQVVPAGRPLAPTAVSAVAGVNQAIVSWTAADANGSSLTLYTVTSSPATTAQSTPNGTATSLTFTGLSPGTTYTFTVTATNGVGTGPASAPSNSILTPTVPGAPTIGSASAGDQSANVTWTAPASNGGSAISSYVVTLSVGTSQSASGSATSLLLTGLTNGTTYTFTVTAVNGVGTGPASAATNAVVPAGLPLAPTAVNASAGVNQATVTWTAASANGSAITHYTVTSNPATSAQLTADGITTSLVFTGLAPITAYTFAVTATNAIGTSPVSSPSNSITTPTTPNPPTIGAATAGDQSATITWTAPSNDGGNPIISYTITPSSGASQQAAASANSANFTGLTNGTAYTFTVAARNGVGLGTASAASNPVRPGGYRTAVLASSPSAYYRLNESSGTVAADSSGNGNGANYVGGPTLAASGALINGPDPAVAMNGNADVSSTSASWLPTGSSDRAIELWFNSTGGPGAGQTVFGYGTYGSGGLEVRVGQTNQIQIVDFQTNPKFTTPYVVANGKWHQVVMTYGSGTISIYLDSALLATYVPPALATVSTNGFAIGHDFYEGPGPGGSDPFVGSIDEVAVYGHTLTAAAVLAHYQASGNLQPAVAGQPTAVQAIAGFNQATITWTAAPAQTDYPVSSYVVNAFLGGVAAGTTSTTGTANSGVVTGLRRDQSYTFTVTALNPVGYGQPSSPTNPLLITSGDPDTYVSSVLADTPLIYYRFDDASRSLLADSSGNGRAGVYQNPAVSVPTDSTHPAAVPESADSFLSQPGGGAGRYPNGIGLPSGSASRSIEAWVKGGSIGTLAGYGVASFDPDTNFQVSVRYSNAIQVLTQGESPVVTLPHPLDGQWHQVVVTYQGTTIQVWEDGILAGTVTLSRPLNTVLNAAGLAIGENLDGSSIDEVSVYDHVLSPSRIQDHFAKSGNARPTASVTVTASLTGADNQATITWTPGTSSATYPITGYIVGAVSGSAALNSIGTAASATTAVITGLLPSTAYTFQVSGVNNFGTGVPGVSNSVTTTTTGTNPTYASAVLADAPVSYHRLSDAANHIAADSSGHGNDGVYLSGGAGTGAISNDTGDSGIQGTPAIVHVYTQNQLPLGNSARSVEAWVKPAPNPSSAAIAAYGTEVAGNQYFGIYLVNFNQVEIETNAYDLNSGHRITLPYRIDNGRWHQLVATYDGTNFGLYLDGSLVPGQIPTTGTPLATTFDYRGYEIGESPSINRDYFNGGIDEVAIFATALSAARVKAHFDAAGYRRPTAVRDVQAFTGPSQLWVSWTPPSDTGTFPLDGYKVTAAGRSFSVNSTLSSVTIPDLTGPTTVDIQPLAGFGGDHAQVTGTPDAALPSAPPDPGISVAVGYVRAGSADNAQVQVTNNTSSDYFVAVAADLGEHQGLPFGLPSVPEGPYVPFGFGTVPAGGSLVLGIFDLSDLIPMIYPGCQQDPYAPTVYIASLAVAGQDQGRVMTGSFRDNGQILISGGIDKGNCGGEEASGFVTLGTTNSDALQLLGNPAAIPCGCQSTSHPVDDATGNFYHSFMDLGVPGRGIPLAVGRTYNSLRAPYDGPLGFGWSSHYTMHLAQDITSGQVVVTQENGSTVNFDPPQKNQDGTVAFAGYHAPGAMLATLVKNADSTWTFKRTDNVSHVFNSRGELADEFDLNGYHTQLSYAAGQLQTVTEPAGRTLTFGYTGQRITSVSDSSSRSVAYHYNAGGELDQSTDVGGKNDLFAYAPANSHLLLTMQDPNRGVVTNVYDTYGRVVNQKDALQRATTFNYSPAGTKTITDPKGNVIVEKYEMGHMVSRTAGFGTPQAATSTYTYDRVTSGLASVTDPGNHTISYTYDANGNKLTSTDPLNRVRSSTYNSLNKVLTSSDPSNLVSTNTYDGNGNLTLASKPLTDASTTITVGYTYDPAHPGDLIQVNDSNGKVSTFAYDQYGNATSATDPLGNRASAAYDALGRVSTYVSPRGNAAGANPPDFTTQYFYNSYGNPTSVVDPLGHTVQYFYDNDQNLTSTIDPNTHTTATTYNLANEVTIMTRADNSQLKFFYDLNGNLREQDDGLGNPTTYAYDPLNRQVSVTDPLNRATQLTYDPASRVLTKVDAMNRTTTYGYDADGQLMSESYSDGVTPNVSYTYNGIGQRLTMTDGTGTTSYTYDSLHRVKTVTNGAGKQVGYGYDQMGHVTSINYPGTTGTVSRQYDDSGRVHQITDWQGHSTVYNYNADGALSSMNYPNGTLATFSVDNADRQTGIVDSLSGTPFLNLPLARASGGQLTGQGADTYTNDVVNRLHLWTNPAATTTTYQYDNADQLLNATIAGGNHSIYSYDVASQLQSLTVNDSGGGQVAAYSFNYNANGNRVQMNGLGGGGPPSTTYGYDQANRLVNFNGVASYGYSGDAIRMSKTIGGSTTQYTWESIDGLAQLLQDGGTSYVTGAGGRPLEQIKADGTIYYYHQDQVGSTRALTDAIGAVLETYSYSPYGALLSSTGSIANPFQWAGEYLDSESGLVYLRSRYYDSMTSQFMTSDKGGSGHRYVYASSDPLNRVDPNGTMDVQLRCELQGFQMAMGVLGMIPGLGEIALAADLVVTAVLVADDLISGNYGTALLDGIGILAFAGAAYKTMKVFQAARAGRAAATAARAERAAGAGQSQSAALFSNSKVGDIVEWGTGPGGPAMTERNIANIDAGHIAGFQEQGLTLERVQQMLEDYRAAKANPATGGLKSDGTPINVNLDSRIAYLERIIELWGK